MSKNKLDIDFYRNEIEQYGRRESKHIPIINSIKEGMVILDWLNATDAAKAAYYLHPMFQTDAALINALEEEKYIHYHPYVLLLITEYRNKSNAWRIDTKIDDQFEPPTLPIFDVKTMLIADKIQHYKDFIDHRQTHPHAIELDLYFNKWLLHLGAHRYVNYCMNMLEKIG